MLLYIKKKWYIIFVSTLGVAFCLVLLQSNNAQYQRPGYPRHEKVVASMFYIGEPASADNGYIANSDSTWDERWEEQYGGIDDPNNRKGLLPAGFIPKENPFYVALPYNDLDEEGNRKPSAAVIYWRDQAKEGRSLVKDRWVEVCRGVVCAYGQVEDAGPFGEDDAAYVFGKAKPQNAQGLKAGIDVSPAIDQYLNLNGSGTVAWRFVDAPPAGPWDDTITK
jgi:hypothetical protein